MLAEDISSIYNQDHITSHHSRKTRKTQLHLLYHSIRLHHHHHHHWQHDQSIKIDQHNNIWQQWQIPKPTHYRFGVLRWMATFGVWRWTIIATITTITTLDNIVDSPQQCLVCEGGRCTWRQASLGGALSVKGNRPANGKKIKKWSRDWNWKTSGKHCIVNWMGFQLGTPYFLKLLFFCLLSWPSSLN